MGDENPICNQELCNPVSFELYKFEQVWLEKSDMVMDGQLKAC